MDQQETPPETQTMTPADLAFYEWVHANSKTNEYLPPLRRAFLAGWLAATEANAS
jgi:hypothetical protein